MSTFNEIPLQDLSTSENNVRSLSTEDLSSESFVELRDSIKKEGLLEPLVVMKGIGQAYSVIAGRRRLLALQEIWGKKNTAIPCMVVEGGEAVDQIVLSAQENGHRKDLSFQEWKDVVDHLKKMGLNQREIAKRLHKSDAWVSAVRRGLTWMDQKKETAKKKSNDRLGEERIESFECPSCGHTINRRTGGSDQVVGQVAYEVVEERIMDRAVRKKK